MIGVLNDEMRALQEQFTIAADKTHKLQTDYDALLDRFLRRAQEEAERVRGPLCGCAGRGLTARRR
jgi:hypothetical protein